MFDHAKAQEIALKWVERVSDSVPEELFDRFKELTVGFLTDLLSGEKDFDSLLEQIDDSLIEEMIRKGQRPENFIGRLNILQEIISENVDIRSERFYLTFEELQIKFLQKVLKIYSKVIAEENLEKRKSERALRILADLSDVILKAESERDLLEDVCRIVVEVGGYDSAWITYPAENGSFRIRTRYGSGRLQYLDSRKWDELPADVAMETKKPVLIKNSFKTSEQDSMRIVSFREDSNYLLITPLKYRDEIYGALNIYTEKGDGFDDEELILLSKFAENISYAISKMRTESEKNRIDKLYRLLLDNTGTGIVLLDGDRIVFANRKMGNLLQSTTRELTGRNFIDFVHEQDREKVTITHRNVAECRYFDSISYRMRFHTSGGDIKHGMAVVTKFSEEGRLILSLTDITDLTRANRQIEENIETFAFLVDRIRNPLTAIYGFVDEFEKDERIRRVVFRQIERIVELIQQLEEGWLESSGVRDHLGITERQ